MAGIDLVSAIQDGMSDPEFSREIRFFTGSLKLAVADTETVATFDDGRLIEVAEKSVPDDDCKIVIRGTQDHWDFMTERYPVPFYQCLQTTVVKHGMYITTTNESFAYLPALNRLVQLLRIQKNGATNGAA
jgi:hypothetical protein